MLSLSNNGMTTCEIVIYLVIIIGVAAHLIFDCFIIYYEERVKWIKREMESLEALINDYDQLVKKGDEVKARAYRFWDSDDLSGIRLQLSEAESEWTKSTRLVVGEAKECVTNYYEHKGGLLHGFVKAVMRLKYIRLKHIRLKNIRRHTIEVFYKIDTVKSKMIDHIERKDDNAKDIYKSMEDLRSKIRSLSDQYTSEEAGKSEAAQNPKQKQPSTCIDELMKMGKDLFSCLEERWSIQLLLPLNAFVKDLSQLQLETETERRWKTEAEKLIRDAEVCGSSFLWWVSRASFLKKRIPIVTYLLTDDLKRIVTEFDDLLARKKKYNFSFIDIAAEKSTFPSNTNDNAIASAIGRIQSKLNTMDRRTKQVAELNSMRHDLQAMYEMLQKAEDQETAGKSACLEQLKSIANEVDNILERYLNEADPNHHEIRNAIDLLRKIINNCTIKRQEPTKPVGLKNDIRDLVSKLTTRGDSPSNSVLSIVGMKGVGKTTLAKAIYYNKAVVEHFPVRVWVTVTSGAADKSQVLLIKKDGTNNQTLNVTQVCDHLKEKPCLVVLDNVSNTRDFDELHGILSKTGMANGGRIVLTTRFKDVALHADRSSTPHQIRLLTKEESWELFKKVIGTEKSKLEHVETLARKVVGRCGGLPLAISSIGFVVQAKGMTQKHLLWVLDRINHGHFKEHWLKAWEKNKEGLDTTMTDCLYYFTHFPLGFEIPARRLVNLWVAEGFVKQNNQQKAEDIAEKCLGDLRDCNMIQAVALKSNGKIKTCQLPSTLREIILRDSDRISHSQYSGTHLERRFAYRFDDHSRDANSANVFSQKGIPLSVFFFDNREGSKPGEHVKKILSTGIAGEQFWDVRVLDLERIFKPQLPQALCKLIHITYLSLRWTYLEEFPQFIGKMVNLKTLDLKHTCIRVLPSSIWKLKKLETLYLNQKYRSRLEGKLRGNYQENLHTLWGVFMYGDCPLLHDLHRLTNLQKLKLAFQLTPKEKEALAAKIVKLNQLHSLRLRSVDEIGSPKKLILHDMSKLENLSSLQLFGKIEDKLQMNHLPQNLTDLTLSESKLSDDPMPALQSLLKLRTLCFYANSYTGRKMVCTTGSFTQLQVLRFWNLEELQEWEVSEGAMPSLMEFEARSCGNLAVPTGLKHLKKTLLLIKLHEMPKPFMRHILNRKKTLLHDVEIDH